MTRLWTLWLIGGVACGEADTTPWWEVRTNVGASEDGDDFFDDDDEEEDFDVDERLFWGELPGSPGAFGEGAVGLFVVQDGRLRCEMEARASVTGDAEGCDACEHAVVLALGELEVFEDEGCDDAGLPELAATQEVGHAGGRAFWKRDGGWDGGGYSELEPGEGWFFEIPL